MEWVTPGGIRRAFGEGKRGQGRESASVGFGTVFRGQQGGAGAGNSSGTSSGTSWGSRGGGRRLGGD